MAFALIALFYSEIIKVLIHSYQSEENELRIRQNELLKLSMFEQMSKQELKTINTLMQDFPVFQTWIKYTLTFKEIINELENYSYFYGDEPLYPKNHVIKQEDNVYFINFYHKKFSPFVIFLNNFKTDLLIFEQLKLYVFLLLELCSLQKRDCIIHLASGEIINFSYGHLKAINFNVLTSIKCNTMVKHSYTDEFQNVFQHFKLVDEECEVMIVSGSPIEIEVLNPEFPGLLSAIFPQEEILLNSNLPLLDKLYFIKDFSIEKN